MCNFEGELKDLGTVPEELLQALDRKVAEDPGLWLRSDMAKPNKFAAFRGSTLHIVFQYPVNLASHEESAYAPIWSEWEPVVRPLVDHATAAYGYRRGRTTRIMLARLLRRKEVAPHVDAAPSAEVPNKIHIPLVTDPRVRFLIGAGDYHLERGRAYEVNNRVRHSVVNGADTDRIHLIFDYYDAG